MKLSNQGPLRRLTFSALVLALAPSALAADIAVPGDYPTIQAAIDVAAPGDVIQVESGVYGAISITVDGLTLEGGENVVIDGGVSLAAVEILADDVTVEDFDIIAGSSYGVLTKGNNAAIVDNTITGGFAGVQLDFSVSGSYIADNEILNPITVGVAALLFCTNNHIVNNTVIGGYNGYLSFGFNVDNVWEDNVAIGNIFRGFFVQSWGDTYVGNTALGSLGDGFFSQFGWDNTLIDNVARDNARSGFVFGIQAPNNVLMDNLSSGNGEYGYADFSTGGGTAGTGNFYTDNTAEDNALGASNPAGLTEE